LPALTQRVRRRVIGWFRRQGFLDAHAAADMRAWENSGCSRDASVRITLLRLQLRVSRQSLERLLRSCARPPLALERLSVIRDADGRSARIRSVMPRHKAATWVGPGRSREKRRFRGEGGRSREPLSGPGQPRDAGATRSRAAHPSGNAGGSAIDRASLRGAGDPARRHAHVSSLKRTRRMGR
jgi:hypothetical protein